MFDPKQIRCSMDFLNINTGVKWTGFGIMVCILASSHENRCPQTDYILHICSNPQDYNSLQTGWFPDKIVCRQAGSQTQQSMNFLVPRLNSMQIGWFPDLLFYRMTSSQATQPIRYIITRHNSLQIGWFQGMIPRYNDLQNGQLPDIMEWLLPTVMIRNRLAVCSLVSTNMVLYIYIYIYIVWCLQTC